MAIADVQGGLCDQYKHIHFSVSPLFPGVSRWIPPPVGVYKATEYFVELNSRFEHTTRCGLRAGVGDWNRDGNMVVVKGASCDRTQEERAAPKR
eukprot:3536439-Pyramimonas_sp.AAC.1